MPLKNFLLSVSIFFVFVGWFCPSLTAQNGKNEQIPANNLRKSFSATRTSIAPKIDGILFDKVWEKATPASGFFQYEPNNDRAASFETQVRVLYDDKAIYISALMFDPNPDSILTELGLRDSGDQLNADRFWVDINPFNDGINGFRFQVSASGVQTDINLLVVDQSLRNNSSVSLANTNVIGSEEGYEAYLEFCPGKPANCSVEEHHRQ